MPNTEIQEFAKVLVQQVRDAAVQSSDANLRPNIQHAIAQRWREASRNGIETIAAVMIPDIVDETIFQLLRAIDQGVLTLSYPASSGKTVELAREGRGELAWWYMGSGGWRSMYSAERFADDFSDLK